MELSGFANRLDDIDRLASIGIQRMRFPILWERCAGRATDDASQLHWAWSDSRIERLRAHKVAPIVGLLHHGSGPRGTDLLDATFPQRFADFAQAVAQRYPDVDAYTPINEPLTTARFCGLYGLWYPHRSDNFAFVRALLNQTKACVLAMRAIRAIQPSAMLIQTEDLGSVSSTPRLRYQAQFENERRWLTFDLLCGLVDPDHPMWPYLGDNGASETELFELLDQPLPPDVLGLNIYVTSERFLDDRLDRYAANQCGGNGRHRCADVETIRVDPKLSNPFESRLDEAHERYQRPLALTEVHLNCSREEQMRWLNQAWQSAHRAKAKGVDVRAVTAWSAFGSHDWDSLLTQQRGHYETGLWDTSKALPRLTGLATLASALARDEAALHPVLEDPGWWQRDVRLWSSTKAHPPQHSATRGRPIVITGARGTLGVSLAQICAQRGLSHKLLSRAEMDIIDPDCVNAALERWRPWALINAAGYVRVDDAEHEPLQWRQNAMGPAVLAGSCAQHGVKLLSFSSDLVFNGAKSEPYLESDFPSPLNAYGRGKLEAERRVLQCAPDALMVRTSAFFGPWDRHNFITCLLHDLRQGNHCIAAADQYVSPTYVPDLVQACLDLLIDGESGIWHLANRGALSWAEFALLAADMAGLNRRLVQPCSTESLNQSALRPGYSALGSERGSLMPCLEDGMARYFKECAGS